ncbi:MAG: hypothetical protein AAB390_03550, partial [Patescibacteria group bacterium]
SFDRYFLPIFSFVLIILILRLKNQKFSTLSAGAVLLVYAFFSLTQTAFYMNWNRVRWELTATAMNRGIETFQLDAGYEWNGWHSYWSARNSGLSAGTITSPWWIRALFVNNTEDYIVASSPIRPYSVIASETVPGFNPNNRLYLLKKPD